MAKKKLFFYSQGVIEMEGKVCFSAALRFFAFVFGSFTSRVSFTRVESSRGSTITFSWYTSGSLRMLSKASL